VNGIGSPVSGISTLTRISSDGASGLYVLVSDSSLSFTIPDPSSADLRQFKTRVRGHRNGTSKRGSVRRSAALGAGMAVVGFRA
jgi:hypothetical protein